MSEIIISAELLESLAPREPINQDEMGGCVWCGGTPPKHPYGYAERKLSHHSDDCPWIRARALLGDALR